MLSQNDIDYLMSTIESGNPAYVYYIAHMIEGRETDILDESSYKDVSKFKVVKVQVEDIKNAYLEYLDYENNPNDYYIEEEEYYYHPSSKYIQQFITPKVKNTSKDLNPRTPSIIYGYTRKVFDKDGTIKEIKDPSPIKPVYTNILEYMGENVELKRVKWKYIKAKPNTKIDGIEYQYITSDWYILSLKNYPMIEKPLIAVNQHSSYFIDIQDAFRYIEQLVA